MNVIRARIAVRKGTAAEWLASTEILAEGELGYDSTNKILKVGNGTSLWADLTTAATWSGTATLDSIDDTATYVKIEKTPGDLLNAMNVTTLVNQATTASNGTVTLKDDGTNNAVVVQDNDSRLTDSRTPTSHKSTHSTGGDDALVPSDIGAASTSDVSDAVSTHSDLTNAVHGVTNANAFDAMNRLSWNDTDKTIEFPVTDDVTLQIGQEQLVYATNNTGSNITNGQVVYISGALGQRPTIALAKADASATATGTIGIATEDIPNNGSGMVVVNGIVRAVPIADLTPGDEVFLSAATAGAYTKTKPTRPYNIVRLGTCINTTGASSADIYVSIHAVQDLKDVGQVALGVTKELENDDFLRYDGTHWRNAVNPAANHIANTTIHVTDKSLLAEKPTTSTGPGEFKQFSSALGAALSLPAGGASYAYTIICMKSDGTLNLTTPLVAGIAVGGTIVGAAIAGHIWIGTYYCI
jgi:hypothetical protein